MVLKNKLKIWAKKHKYKIGIVLFVSGFIVYGAMWLVIILKITNPQPPSNLGWVFLLVTTFTGIMGTFYLLAGAVKVSSGVGIFPWFKTN